MKQKNIFTIVFALGAISPSFLGCGKTVETQVRVPVVEKSSAPVRDFQPGIAPKPGRPDQEVWTESMVDTIKVPAQIDPTGTYYRPAHKTLMEIRPDKVQDVDYDEKK
jgi:hypothetical protein